MRRLGALDRLRLYKVIGANLGTNAPYLGIAMLAVSVCSVDGVPMPPPVSEAQLEALVARLGDAGIAAAAAAMRQLEPSCRRETSWAPRSGRHLVSGANGVPFDVAFSLEPEERLDWVVALGTLDGREYDWTTRRWKQPE